MHNAGAADNIEAWQQVAADNNQQEGKAMTEYRIQIKTDSGYETSATTSSLKTANNRAKDLASCGYDGRIVTAKGHVSQEWEIVRS